MEILSTTIPSFLKEQECQGINKLVIFIKILSSSKVTASRFAIKLQPLKSSDDSHAEFVNQYDDQCNQWIQVIDGSSED